MKTFTLLLVLFGHPAFCQPPSHVKYPLQQFGWDNSTYVSKEFGSDVLQKTIRNKQGRVWAQLYRYNDSAEVYEEYDTSGRVICKGILRLCSENSDTIRIEMPDYINDPAGTLGLMKDTSIINMEYGKHGYWMERQAGDTLWHGSYTCGKRNGIWKRSRETDHTRFPQVDTLLFYKNDIGVDWPYTLSADAVFALLKGTWYNNAVLSSKHYLFLQKEAEKSGLESDFNFLDKKKMYQLYVGTSYWPPAEEYKELALTLVKKDGQFFLYASGRPVYQIIYADAMKIILKIK